MAPYMKRKPKLVIEFHPGEEGLTDYLKSLGYSAQRPSKYFVIATP